MADQIFISYRRDGGDTTAKLICETLKNRGYTVFYDFDTLKGGYFDERILDAIRDCNDVVLVLPPHALDRCVNEDDWVRREISFALSHGKRIIPIMMKGFSFPKSLPADIEEITRYNGVLFYMEYFDAAIDKIVEKLSPATKARSQRPESAPRPEPKPTPKPAPKPQGKKKSDTSPAFRILLIAYLAFLLAAVLCAILLPVARHYIIGALIGLHYTAIWVFLADATADDADAAGPLYGLHLAVSIALLITSIPFLCFAGTLRTYAIFLSASMLITSLILYVIAKKAETNDFETVSTRIIGELAAMILLICVTILIDGLWQQRLILGVGALVISFAFAMIGMFRSEYDRVPDAVLETVFAALYFAVGFAFFFINRTFAFWSIVAFAIALLRFIFLYIEYDLLYEEEYGGFVGGILGITAFIGAAVLVFFFAHHDDPFSAKGNVLKDYYGGEETVYISEEITEIADDCFYHYGCMKTLKEVRATSVETIGERAFADCLALHTLHLGAELRSIGSGAFRNCDIQTIYFYGTPEEWDAVEKYDGSGAWYDLDWCSDEDYDVIFINEDNYSEYFG